MVSSAVRPKRRALATTDAELKAARKSETVKLAAAFGTVLRQEREQRLMTQADLGAKADLDPNFVGMVERAERNVTLYSAWRLAGGLGLTLSELLQPLPLRRAPRSRRS